MHTLKVTPNLLFGYQCTSGKFIRLPNRIEKIDSVARIESNRNFFCPNWNALVSGTTRVIRYQKGKTNVDFTEARDSECQHHTAQVFTGRMPFLSPNQQRQSTEGQVSK